LTPFRQPSSASFNSRQRWWSKCQAGEPWSRTIQFGNAYAASQMIQTIVWEVVVLVLLVLLVVALWSLHVYAGWF